MAKPRVFISSTYYDLKHVRASLENFIELLGYDPVLSEKGDIAYMPDAPLDESCYREVGNADIYVLIIGGRYGSQASDEKQTSPNFFTRYDSITKMEYESAVDADIPVYILIEKSVYSDYENWLKNKENNSFKYAHVDSVNIFHLIEALLAQPRNNPIYQFDRYTDIEGWLKEQWAGLLRELLKKLSSQKQLSSLSAQVTELAEINKTLKRYLEAVMVKVSPADSNKLIKSESNRLEEVHRISKIESNPLARYVNRFFDLPYTTIHREIIEANTLKDFIKRVSSLSRVKTLNSHQTQRLLTEIRENALADFEWLKKELSEPVQSSDRQLDFESQIRKKTDRKNKKKQ